MAAIKYRNALVIGGKEYPCIARILTWEDHGIEFKIGEGYNKRRREEIDLAVWHWTGGENPPPTMAAVLQRKKLGIEFSIDRDGIIWQFCDPLTVDTADAGRFNSRSVGTEIINYGFRGKNRPIPSRGKNRPTYTCELRGRRRQFAHFAPAQIAAAIAMADTLSAALPIPRAVPVDPEYLAVLGQTMTLEEGAAFKGHVGHFHLSANKSDPGLDLLEAFRAVWAVEL